MCQSNAYMVDSDGHEELILEDVTHVKSRKYFVINNKGGAENGSCVQG